MIFDGPGVLGESVSDTNAKVSEEKKVQVKVSKIYRYSMIKVINPLRG